METQHKNAQKHVGQFVAEDFRTAAVFSSYGIDFCCKGEISVQEACKNKTIDLNDLLEKLQHVQSSNNLPSIDYKSWPLDLLADYIEKKHHRYVEEKTPVLRQFLDKLCKVHGQRHPELLEITTLFIGCAKDMASHMKKEELILFPFIKRMVRAKAEGIKIESPQFATVENPIALMKHDHEAEGDRFRNIAELTNSYTPPADACNTYKVTFAMLDEFEKDLHLHIHLENNILFPEAIKLEETLS